MYTIKDTQQIGERKTDVKRITILESDGSETVINVGDDIHYLFGFVKVGPEGGVDVPMELLVKGSVDVIGEIYFQAGNRHPELIQHCVKRATMKMAGKIIDEIKKSGTDPIAEALKKMPPPSEKGGWN